VRDVHGAQLVARVGSQRGNRRESSPFRRRRQLRSVSAPRSLAAQPLSTSRDWKPVTISPRAIFTAERKITSCRPSTPADNITGSERGRRASQSGIPAHGGLIRLGGFPLSVNVAAHLVAALNSREWN